MTLFTYRWNDVPLSDALAAFGADAVALVYAPRWCGFARIVGGKLLDSTGQVPRDAYEVRAFHEHAELRWLKNPASADGTGTAAILRETEGDFPGWTPTSREVVTIDPPTTYLLWGQGTESKQRPAGWSVLGLARIEALPVPVDGVRSEKQRVLLHAVEYIAADEYGSAFVCEERLTRLEATNGEG